MFFEIKMWITKKVFAKTFFIFRYVDILKFRNTKISDFKLFKFLDSDLKPKNRRAKRRRFFGFRFVRRSWPAGKNSKS